LFLTLFVRAIVYFISLQFLFWIVFLIIVPTRDEAIVGSVACDTVILLRLIVHNIAIGMVRIVFRRDVAASNVMVVCVVAIF
jgi:hypothetical protein